jgi:RimJ/RimL family protein N-acetyltransferase
MALEMPTALALLNWRDGLPVLAARHVLLREPAARDLGPLIDLLSLADASRFGLDGPIVPGAVEGLIARAAHDRAAGCAITYAIVLAGASRPVGLLQVRRLDPAFETGEWECTVAPSVRGTGVFMEAARLATTFTFETVGARRLEARVFRQNGRANTALRRLGAVEEGVLRRSARVGGEYVDQVLWALLKEEWGESWLAAAARVH